MINIRCVVFRHIFVRLFLAQAISAYSLANLPFGLHPLATLLCSANVEASLVDGRHTPPSDFQLGLANGEF